MEQGRWAQNPITEGTWVLTAAKRGRIFLRVFLLLSRPYFKAGPILSSTWAIQIGLDGKRKRRRKINRKNKKGKKTVTAGSCVGWGVRVERMDLGRVEEQGGVNTF